MYSVWLTLVYLVKCVFRWITVKPMVTEEKLKSLKEGTCLELLDGSIVFVEKVEKSTVPFHRLLVKAVNENMTYYFDMKGHCVFRIAGYGEYWFKNRFKRIVRVVDVRVIS